MLFRRLAATIAVAAMPWAALALGTTAWSTVTSHQGPWSLELSVSVGATAAAAFVAAYLALTGLLAGVDLVVHRFARHPGQRKLGGATAAITPTAWSRIVATALGISLVATPAMASGSDTDNATLVSATWTAATSDASTETTDAPPTEHPRSENAGWTWGSEVGAPSVQTELVANVWGPTPASTLAFASPSQSLNAEPAIAPAPTSDTWSKQATHYGISPRHYSDQRRPQPRLPRLGLCFTKRTRPS